MRPIDADALRLRFEEMTIDPCAKTMKPQSWAMAYESACVDVDRMPTLDYVPRQQWISVKDGLPETFTEVMVYTDGYGGKIERAHIGVHGWISNGAILIPNVTHWMPLPEPPKEER